MGYRQAKRDVYHGKYKDLALQLATQENMGSNRLIKMGHTVGSGGAGATVVLEDNAGETLTQRGATGLTLVGASDTDDVLYDGETITIYYITTAGAKASCSMEYNTANSTTEVAFTDTATGLVAVTDFYCLDPDYGLAACVSSVAVQAGDNVCIGITGCVAGIADPDTCFIKILAAATSPVAANIYGVGSISGDEAANQADTGYIWYEEYVTPWGEIKHGTWTFPADSSVSTRFVSTEDTAAAGTTWYVNDYYRSRFSSMDHVAIDECRIGDWEASEFYGAIEIASPQQVFSRHFTVREADVAATYLAGIRFAYAGPAAETCTLTITGTLLGEAGPQTLVSETTYGGEAFDWLLELQLEPLTELTASIVDDAATGGNYQFAMDILEAW